MNHSIWGFKDPRTVLVLGPWLKAIPDANLVGIFRHPYRVANSLNSRNEIPLSKALELWVKYNRVLLWHYKNTRNFPIIEFTADEFAFKNSVNALTIKLGLGSSHDEFYDHSLLSTAEINEEALRAADRNSNALRIYEELKSIIN